MSVDIKSHSAVSSEKLRPGFYFFKARWCHYCKLATPIIEEVHANGRYGKYVHEISVGSEDEEIRITPPQRVLTGKSFDELHELFHVRGYPTLVMVSLKGEMTPYQGQRTASEITRAIERQDFFKE